MSLDLLAAAAAGLATFGVTLAFYRLVGHYEEGTVAVGLSGWHFSVGLLGWILVLAAALALWGRRLPRGPTFSRWIAGGVATAAAVAATLTSVIALVDRPEGRDVAAAAFEHVAREELLDVATQAQGWMSVGSEVELGLGPFLLILAALLALLAGARVLATGT